ncbi:MAG: hypothetical protein N2652_01790 [Kiritimatiellae bacterium]|nr:hypothetical protein [Kiritimatiellia bacterium]
MKRIPAHIVAMWIAALSNGAAAEVPPLRWVWIFGWSVHRERDLPEILQLVHRAARAGANGVVMGGFDTLCRASPVAVTNIARLREACEREGLELVPALFAIGYGGWALAHDPHLAEGLPVRGARMIARGSEIRWEPEPAPALRNPGFEEHTHHRFPGFRFVDLPGVISFADTSTVHEGRSSLRLENFTAHSAGNARAMQEVQVRPWRTYRFSVWVRTENLAPADALRVQVLAGDRSLAPREFHLGPTRDWTQLSVLFNSMEFETVRLYAGVWGGRAGRLWLDDWQLEEVGPSQVLRRPGTPVSLHSDDGAVAYLEGRDFIVPDDPRFSPYRPDRPPLVFRRPESSRIRDGERLRADWYHPMVVHESQVTVCMAEPKLDEIAAEEAERISRLLRPRRALLSMDEVRMGGTCRACEGCNMAELLGRCAERMGAALRRHLPEVELFIWSDMFDPHHNARAGYYLVRGDFTGSWRHLPREVAIVVWGGGPREASLRFFANEGRSIVIANYYDADDLTHVREWLELGRALPQVRGYMYTTWQKRYELLDDYARLVWGGRPAAPR